MADFSALTRKVAALRPLVRVGRIVSVRDGTISIAGLTHSARIGDLVGLRTPTARVEAEVIALNDQTAVAMVYAGDHACAIGDPMTLFGQVHIRPDPAWRGRLVDAFAQPLDGRPLPTGPVATPLRRTALPAGQRRPLGPRLNTGMAVTDTFLPLARGQRVGVFAGSGVGKTSLLGAFARGVDADVVVIGLIGERGRELDEFITGVLGREGMAKAIIVAATSDQSPLLKRRAAWTATAVAEYFRDIGLHVLLILDSLTRFAEAHREVALTAGEAPSLRAFPPSTAHIIAALTERAGTGSGTAGDITAVYSVLVAGSDMDEPVADFARGVLDGHIVLDRAIAERGRFPAIDISKSVSRSLPAAADGAENALLVRARRVFGDYADAESLIRSGLYAPGSDPAVDRAAALWPGLDAFAARTGMVDAGESFAALAEAMNEDPGDPGSDVGQQKVGGAGGAKLPGLQQRQGGEPGR